MRRLGIILAITLISGVVLVVVGTVAFIGSAMRSYLVTENLIYAAAEADHDAMRASLRAGADVNGRNDERKTALEFAISNGENGPERTRETLRLLFEAGADPDLPSSDGRWPLELTYDPAMLRFLKSYGAHYGPKRGRFDRP